MLVTPPLTMNQAAAALGVSRRWLQGYLKEIDPCWLECCRRKLFDEAAMTAIREAMRACHTSSSSRRLDVGRIGVFAGRKIGNTSIVAQALRLAATHRGS